jgi:hypothetical protein
MVEIEGMAGGVAHDLSAQPIGDLATLAQVGQECQREAKKPYVRTRNAGDDGDDFCGLSRMTPGSSSNSR